MSPEPKELQAQGVEVMILSGTLDYAGAGQNFDFGDATIVKLPLVDYRVIDGRRVYVDADGTPFEESLDAINERKKVICAAVQAFAPDVVLAELYPFAQAFRKFDIEAAKDAYAGSKYKPEFMSLCRDIIHNSKADDVLDELNASFNRLLVRGDDRFAKLTESQPDWEKITQPIEYMGNFITLMPQRDVTIPESERPVIVFGGGGYLESDLPFFESLIRSRARSALFADHPWDIYISENSKKHTIADPLDASGQTQITVFDYLTQLAAWEGQGRIRVSLPIESEAFRQQLANAATAITRGGYNTTFELYAAEVPQLVIPRFDKEQIQRANRLYRHGMAQVYPEYPIPEQSSRSLRDERLGDIDTIAEAIDLTPQITASCTVKLNNHGAERTATRLSELIDEKRVHEMANRVDGADGSSTGWYNNNAGRDSSQHPTSF